MDNISLWKHQKKAVKQTKKYDKCLINIWCGCGKTRIIVYKIFDDKKDLNVIVFPSLGLINQFNNDYILKNEWNDKFSDYKFLSFCSDNEKQLKIKTNKIKYTTDSIKIKKFLYESNKKLLTVTYQSFDKLVDIVTENNIKINRLYYDEAHHIVGDNIQKLVFQKNKFNSLVNKTEFYTATPINKNKITMYDREYPENSDCGPLAFEYLYYQAQEDKICKGIETQITLYTILEKYENKYQPIFESIIRTCLSNYKKYDYWNILSFHSFVNDCNNDNISYVKDFANKINERLFIKLFLKIQNDEFPETKQIFTKDKIIMKGVGNETQNRQNILDDFDKKVKGRIFLLSSCRTLNEGIDTKYANMAVPISPSQSIVCESQRIGRLTRKPEDNMADGIILIPCFIDTNKYKSIDNPLDRDKMIREQMSENGNFNCVLNIISAFKYQYDPDLFEMCLRYPNMYAPEEIKNNLEKYGFKLEDFP